MDVHGSQLANLQGFCSCGSLEHLCLLWVVPIEANAMVLGCFLSETHSTQYISPLYSLYNCILQVGQSPALSEQHPRPNPENQ